MRLALLALAALLLVGCGSVHVIVLPLPVPVTPAETPTPFVATGETPQVRVVEGNVTVYAGPYGQFADIGFAREGEVLPVLGRTADNHWLKVLFAGQEGWIGPRNTVPHNPETFGPGGAAIPVATPPPTFTPTPAWLTAP